MITVHPINPQEWPAELQGPVLCVVAEFPHNAWFEITGLGFRVPICKIHLEDLQDEIKGGLRLRRDMVRQY